MPSEPAKPSGVVLPCTAGYPNEVLERTADEWRAAPRLHFLYACVNRDALFAPGLSEAVGVVEDIAYVPDEGLYATVDVRWGTRYTGARFESWREKLRDPFASGTVRAFGKVCATRWADDSHVVTSFELEGLTWMPKKSAGGRTCRPDE